LLNFVPPIDFSIRLRFYGVAATVALFSAAMCWRLGSGWASLDKGDYSIRVDFFKIRDVPEIIPCAKNTSFL
jgi:hypothetical protein